MAVARDALWRYCVALRGPARPLAPVACRHLRALRGRQRAALAGLLQPGPVRRGSSGSVRGGVSQSGRRGHAGAGSARGCGVRAWPAGVVFVAGRVGAAGRCGRRARGGGRGGGAARSGDCGVGRSCAARARRCGSSAEARVRRPGGAPAEVRCVRRCPGRGRPATPRALRSRRRAGALRYRPAGAGRASTSTPPSRPRNSCWATTPHPTSNWRPWSPKRPPKWP